MLRALVCVWILAGLALAAAAEPRYAVLIGNEDYPATVGPLSLPHQDVENMRIGLVQAGFPADHIKVLNDATQIDINLAVAQLSSDLRTAGPDAVGFFYYSGHGGSAESSGTRANYLIPAKSPITGAEQLPILGVPVNNVIDALAASDAKAIFFVSDACRNTLPFTSSKGGSADKGMVRVPRKRGLYIAFATADGATTPDDGLFSKSLSKRLAQKGLSADRAFTLALREVAAARPGNALPFTADGLTEDICFAGCEVGPPVVHSEDADYVAASRTNTVEAYLDFIQAWPQASFVSNAQDAIVKLFYEDHPSARKYNGHNDNIVGPPALLEAFHQAGEAAFRRGENQSAVNLFQGACQSGLGKSCTRLAEMMRRGDANFAFLDNEGKLDSEAREATMYAMYQIGCALGDQAGCTRLTDNGHALPDGCIVEIEGDKYDWCEENGVTPVLVDTPAE
ncbi:MAG: hypothetical protein VR75_07615 [Hyphomonadaceae bacterium BRH_c29]|nr:MAG: hypothetical protein VR75_07615 [Hyphomonadaceae bacterium BRH_c29]